MDSQEKALDSIDKFIFYVERADIYLFVCALFKYGPTIGALMLAPSLVLTSMLTFYAYWKVHGKDFRAYRQRFDVLYMAERTAVLIFLCCIGAWRVGYYLLLIFLQQTSIFYLFLAMSHTETIRHAFPLFLIGPCLAARDRVYRGSICSLLCLQEERVDNSPVPEMKQESDNSWEGGWDGEDVEGDDETENGYNEEARRYPGRYAEEETGNRLHSVKGKHLQEVDRKLVEQGAEEETGNVTEDEMEDDLEDREDERKLGSLSSEQMGTEYQKLPEKSEEELYLLMQKQCGMLSMAAAQYEEEMYGLEEFYKKRTIEMERAHQEEMDKLCAEHQKKRCEWETQKQTLLEAITERESRDGGSRVHDCCREQLGDEHLELMKEWRRDLDSFYRDYREFQGEFRDSVQLMKERNAYLDENVRAGDEEAKRLKALLEKSEETRSALQVERDELVKSLLWATSMCNYYQSCMGQLVPEELLF